MRKLYAAILCAFFPTCTYAPAFAQQCVPIEFESFVARAIATLGPEDRFIHGAQAAAFREEVGMDAQVLAVFLAKREDIWFFVLVLRGSDGSEAACIGEASDAGRALFHKLYGSDI